MAHPRRTIAVLLLLLLSAVAGRAEDWPQWRGPGGSGNWNEARVLEAFGAEGVKVRWRRAVGPGYSSPIIASGRVYVTDVERVRPDARERVLCMEEATGKVLWTHTYDVRYPAYAYTPQPGMGPTATPIADGGKVYTLGSLGHLCCLDAASGAAIWQKDLAAEYGAREFNLNASPLIEGELLLLYVGGKPGACVVALDKATGKELWKALDEQGTNSTPALITAGGKRQLIVWTQVSVTSLEPATGKSYWRIPLVTGRDVAISTPVAAGNLLLIGGLMLKLDDDRPGVSILWPESKAPARRVLSNTSTALLAGGQIYSARSTGELVCLDAATGKQLWETDKVTDLRNGASIHLNPQGDGVFLYTNQGELIRARLSAEGYREVGRARLIDPIYPFGGRKVAWSPPAYANRHVFVRNEAELVCALLAAAP